MANVINGTSTGSGGLITTGDDSGILNIQTNETTAMSIDASQSVDFTNNIDAPNTFGFKNRIINGGMVIDQRNAGASVNVSSTAQYPADRFSVAKDTAAATVTAQQSSTVPTGFTKSILWTTSTGAAPSAGDDNFISHRIEGFNFADFGFGTAAAQSFTLSFWVRSSVAGTYGISLNNDSANRCFMATYTISSANTYEYKTITVPGDTTGTWLTTNGIGLRIFWDLGAGTSRSIAASSAWGSTYGTGLTGGTKLILTTGATLYITGVQLEKGTQATSFDFRSIGQEYLLCQRYYQRITPNTSGNAGDGGFSTLANYSSTGSYGGYVFPIPMRTGPSGSYSALTDFAYLSNAAGRTPATIDLSNNSSTRVELVATFGTAGTSGYAGWMRISVGGWLAFSAEL